MDLFEQRDWIPNPQGNPAIKDAPKTGPKTIMGKIRSLLSSGRLKAGNKSTFLNSIRKCNICPLGPQSYEVLTTNGKYTRSGWPICSFWAENKMDCEVPMTEFIVMLSAYDYIREKDLEQMLKWNSIIAFIDSRICAEAETMRYGCPKRYTLMFLKLAMHCCWSLAKLKRNI